MRALILPALGYLGYPMAVAGAVLVFGTCSVLTLDMISRNMGQVVAPVALSPDFNVPAVQQIGSIEPPAPAATAAPAQEPESSIVAVAPPAQSVAVTLAAPELGATFEAVEPPGLGSGYIGGLAVNVRAAPSKTAAKIGVLNAGSDVRIGENVGGWVHVFFSGGDGWVYQTYLAGG